MGCGCSRIAVVDENQQNQNVLQQNQKKQEMNQQIKKNENVVVNTEPKSEGTPKITVKRKPFKPDLKPVKPIKAPIELGPLKIPSQFDAFKQAGYTPNDIEKLLTPEGSESNREEQKEIVTQEQKNEEIQEEVTKVTSNVKNVAGFKDQFDNSKFRQDQLREKLPMINKKQEMLNDLLKDQGDRVFTGSGAPVFSSPLKENN